ncbi:MAG: hypothetical protein D6689_09755 [Deltaproteobacteria bacterium]|nr:MAG: hypothetical protein D6689_09755 [Deltaproteobacteria bacterium]
MASRSHFGRSSRSRRTRACSSPSAPPARRYRTARAIAAIAAAAAACTDGPAPLDEFAIELALDTTGADATCAPGVTCASFPIGCDAIVGVRVLDLPDPDAPDAPPRIREEACVPLSALRADSLCDLADPTVFRVQFTNVKPDLAQVEVVVWRDRGDATCPPVDFTVNTGRPIVAPSDANPPAFGRRVFHDFGGTDPTARVELACVTPDVLDAPECNPRTVDLRADVSNLHTRLDVTLAEAQALGVRIGQPTPVAPGDPRYELRPQDLIELGLMAGATPTWEERDVVVPDDAFAVGSDVCGVVTPFGSQPVATCELVVDDDEVPDNAVRAVHVDAFMVPSDVWDQIQAAIELNVVPQGGLVLGRVVDTNLLPLDNVQVSAVGASPTVQYLNDDLTGFRDGGGAPLAATSTSGYFVARGSIPFKTAWTATRPGTWRMVGQPTGGELGNKTITIVQIVMTQDFEP